MPFTFKRFHIDDSRCGMPVSTDGVLLGAWAPLSQANTILDIGAGSGLLSLMAAQRSQARITAVELDLDSAIDCLHNFSASPWAGRLELVCSDIQGYCQNQPRQFDHIICNPPYFANGPQSNKTSRATARHTDSLSFDSLLGAIKQLLAADGQASIILPTESVHLLESKIEPLGLTLRGRLLAASVAGKTPNRQVLLLGHDLKDKKAQQSNAQTQASFEQQLTIREKNGQYSEAFTQLSQDFYLKL
ncbi:tRNA1(Val) (adenine(37)-N6)-methyltransferase [Shewanella sp. 125m-7]